MWARRNAGCALALALYRAPALARRARVLRCLLQHHRHPIHLFFQLSTGSSLFPGLSATAISFLWGHGTVPPVFLCDYFCALQEAERAMSGGENGSARGERSDGLLLLCMQPLCCNDGVASYCGLGFRDEERKSCFCVLTEIG